MANELTSAQAEASANSTEDIESERPITHIKPARVRNASQAVTFLAVIAFIAALYIAKVILLPIAVAAFIALFSSPLMRLIMRVYIPRPLAAALVVAVVVSTISYLLSLLAEPAMHWLSALPAVGDRITFELARADLPFPTDDMQATGDGQSRIYKALDSTFTTMTTLVAQSSVLVLMQLAAVIMLTYFFLNYGEDLMRNIVRARSDFSQKKKMVIIFQTIRDDVSTYVLGITLINIGLGLATAGVLTLVGFEDALLWGALAAILNFAPYVGPLILATLLASAAFATGEPLDQVLVAPGAFLCVNFIESQLVTPTVFGKRFNVNPLLVVLWMLLWGWLWGAIGMLLAIPILMTFKIACAHLNLIGPWVHLLDGSTPSAQERNHSSTNLFAHLTKRWQRARSIEPAE